jgi:multidrug efflux system outer membrane protein
MKPKRKSTFLHSARCAVAGAAILGFSISPGGTVAVDPGVSLPARFDALDGPESFPAKPDGFPESLRAWLAETGDPELSRAVQALLENNPDLERLRATIRKTRADDAALRSALYPALNLSFSAGRARTGSLPGQKEEERNVFELSMAVSYELDAWGRVRKLSDASRNRVEAARLDRRSLQIGLVCEFIDRYYTAIQLRNRLDLLENLIERAERIEEFTARRYRSGLVEQDALLSVCRSLEGYRAARPTLEAALSRTTRSLSVLAGRYPRSGWPDEGRKFRIPDTLERVPAGLPAALIERRPDLEAYARRVEASGYTVLARERDRLASIRITANGGWSAPELKDIGDRDTSYWGAYLDVAQTVYDGGKKKFIAESEREANRELLSGYREAVLTALGEVEDALDAGARRREHLEYLKRQEAILEARRKRLERRYRRGLADATAVLTASIELIAARMDRLDAERQLCSDRIQLIRALGGPWPVSDRVLEARSKVKGKEQ